MALHILSGAGGNSPGWPSPSAFFMLLDDAEGPRGPQWWLPALPLGHSQWKELKVDSERCLFYIYSWKISLPKRGLIFLCSINIISLSEVKK